jgi:NitT/TauT family transport system substrate-binding protein
MDQVTRSLGTRGPVALVGYTFDRTWAARNGSTVERFLAAARQAKDILASSEVEWQRLAPRIHVTDANALSIYRLRYGEGIVRRPLAEEEADARALYLVLAEIGGADLVGPARELPVGTFYRPAAAE